MAPASPQGTRIAVIVPCFRDGALVREAVGSVREAEPVEIVVVDDHSQDPETEEALRALQSDGVTVMRHESNRGVSIARTTGLMASRAPFVFPLDADDLAVEGRLASLANRLEAAPEAGVVFGDYEEFGDSTLVRQVPAQLDPYRLAYTNEYPISALFRRSVLESVGGFRPAGYDGRSYEDWNLWMALAERGEPGLHAGPGVVVYRRRLHGERKLQSGKRRHPELYRELRAAHPGIFEGLREHRRRSDLSNFRKFAYPIVYGGRRRFPFERRVKALLDRTGLWTLRR
jgi:glycosyltransferase involved in cell wall biosynthesis